jgi:hypothetical protein
VGQLLQDLARGQIGDEAHRSSRTEPASHGAPDLRREVRLQYLSASMGRRIDSLARFT